MIATEAGFKQRLRPWRCRQSQTSGEPEGANTKNAPSAPPTNPLARPHVSGPGIPDPRDSRGLAHAEPVTAGSKSLMSFMTVSQPGIAAANSVPEHRAIHFMTFLNMIRILFSRVDPDGRTRPSHATRAGPRRLVPDERRRQSIPVTRCPGNLSATRIRLSRRPVGDIRARRRNV